MMKKQIYITTSIPYANARPHIGFAFELVLADSEARRRRALGEQVFFLSGADENGLKNYTSAKKVGLTASVFVKQNSQFFKRLIQSLEISTDNFIRTSTPEHHRQAQAFWQALEKAGDIYKKKYRGLYCVGCEAFVLQRDLQDGKCPHHQQPPEIIEEENYFFRLTKYKQQVYQAIKSGQVKILPDARKNELLNLIHDAQDVSFSRPVEKLPWGVDVPGDSRHKMYVWGDALVNYISGLPGETLAAKKQVWQQQDKIIHFIGKDILRFHGLIWLAMLLSAGWRLPSEIRVHGFISSAGQKMSKSLGNVVDPFDYIQKYGSDAVRFYLLKEIPAFSDGDFSNQRFQEIYTALLANELGNLVQRAVVLLAKFNISFLPEKLSAAPTVDSLNKIWQSVRRLNEFISREKLWEAKPGQEEKLRRVAKDLSRIAENLKIYLPQTANQILHQLKTLQPAPLFPKILEK